MWLAVEDPVGGWESVGLALLGLLVAETVEALRVFVAGDSRGGHRWPKGMPIASYLTASALRPGLAALVATALSALGAACNGTLPFVAGLATLKVVEVVFGYSGTRNEDWRSS